MKHLLLVLIIVMLELNFPAQAFCSREINYIGTEEAIYIYPGEPTQLTFPETVSGGFKSKVSNLELEKQDTFLVIFARAEVAKFGEAIIVQLTDKRTFSLRVLPATPESPRDGQVSFLDSRNPINHADERIDYLPPTTVSGLMRELVLAVEMNKKKDIPGFKRSNRFSGETILNDGSLKVTIDEVFMGSEFWGYVLDAENLLDTPQSMNSATFRLDGTKSVTAQRWELAARPITAEQQIARQHTGKVYIIARSKRRKEQELAHVDTGSEYGLPYLLIFGIATSALILLLYIRWNSGRPNQKGIA